MSSGYNFSEPTWEGFLRERRNSFGQQQREKSQQQMLPQRRLTIGGHSGVKDALHSWRQRNNIGQKKEDSAPLSWRQTHVVNSDHQDPSQRRNSFRGSSSAPYSRHDRIIEAPTSKTVMTHFACSLDYVAPAPRLCPKPPKHWMLAEEEEEVV